MALYCWANYEFTKLDQAAADHPHLADHLMAANSALIDLKEEIKGQPFFPVKNYSIKSVAPACGFHWSQADVNGLSAQLMYLDWLKTGDGSIIEGLSNTIEKTCWRCWRLTSTFVPCRRESEPMRVA